MNARGTTVIIYGPGLIRNSDGALLRTGPASLLGKCTVTVTDTVTRRYRVEFSLDWIQHDMPPPSYTPVETSGTSTGNVRYINVLSDQTPEYSDLTLATVGTEEIAIRVYFNGSHTVTTATAYREWDADLGATPPVYAGDYRETLGTVTITLESEG